MAKQLHWCCHICNTIQSWILRNYNSISINIRSVYRIGIVVDTIGYIYTIWVIVDAIHSNCIHKLHINSIIDYNLDGIDPITLEIDVYGIIDYNLDAIDPITLEIESIRYCERQRCIKQCNTSVRNEAQWIVLILCVNMHYCYRCLYILVWLLIFCSLLYENKLRQFLNMLFSFQLTQK